MKVNNIFELGISDICINDKKILGSSMYKKPNKYFYHAVLNFNEDIEFIDKLLLHPTKEPDYRMGRTLKEFITSLKNENFAYSIDYLSNELIKTLTEYKTKTCFY